jgi:hypothetical protein
MPYDPYAPEPDASAPVSLDEQIRQLYQELLGRPPSPEEIATHRGNPGGLEGVRQTILTSPEYGARGTAGVQKAPSPTPTLTPAPTVTGGAPPPGPAPNPPPNPNINPNKQIAPTPNLPPVVTPPAFAPPPAFQYKDFVAPTGADVFDDPGYRFRQQQGESALERSAAARGTLNTGGTLQDVLGFGQQLASQEYGNLYNRRAQEYQMGRGNAVDAYNTNYNTQYKDPYTINYQTQYRDPFLANYQRSSDLYNAGQHNYDQNQYYQTHATDQNRYYDFANQQFDYNKERNNRLDSFDMRYRLLGLM